MNLEVEIIDEQKTQSKPIKEYVLSNIKTKERVLIKQSLRSWSLERGLEYKSIWSLCNGYIKIHKGWYVGDSFNPVKRSKTGKRKPLSAEHKRKIAGPNPYEGRKIISPESNVVFVISGTFKENVKKLGIENRSLHKIFKEGKIVKGWQSYESYLSSKGKITVKESEVVIFGPDVIADTSSKNIRCGIYKITNLKNGKFYIGSTINSIKRFSDHKQDLRQGIHCNIHLQKAWNLYGEENFDFAFIKDMTGSSVEELKIEEQKYIDLYFDNGKNCYNIATVADRPDSEKRKQPVLQIDKKTLEIIKEWASATDVELAWNKTDCHLANQISATCRGLTASAYGYKWKYKDKELASKYKENFNSHGGHMKRRVAQVALDDKNKIICVYESLEDAAKQNDIKSYVHILGVCAGRRATCGGKSFKYISEDEYIKFTSGTTMSKEPEEKKEITKLTCLECFMEQKNLRSLASHLQCIHKIKTEEYVIKHFHGGTRPLCLVEGCGNETRYSAFKFNRYCKLPEHQKIAMIEGGKSIKEIKAETKQEIEKIKRKEKPVPVVVDVYNNLNSKITIDGDMVYDYGTTQILKYNGNKLTEKFISGLSVEEREDIAKELFQWFRKGGFPVSKYPDEDLMKDWKELVNVSPELCFVNSTDETMTGFLSNKQRAGSMLFHHFHDNEFYSAKTKRMLSMKEAFENDELLLKVIRNRLGITYKEFFNIHGAMLKQGFRSSATSSLTSIFNSVVSKYIWKKYLPSFSEIKNGEEIVMFDYSMGFGHRMLGALALIAQEQEKHKEKDFSNIKYVCCDPWSEICKNNLELARFVGMENHVEINNIGTELFDFSKRKDGKYIDIAFSSPPYFDKEIYGGSEPSGQVVLTPSGSSYNGFINVWWRTVVRNIVNHLKEDTGVFILNMVEDMDKSDKKNNHKIADDMVRICLEEGLEVKEKYGLLISKSHFGKSSKTKMTGQQTGDVLKYEPVVVMKKIDTTKCV